MQSMWQGPFLFKGANYSKPGQGTYHVCDSFPRCHAPLQPREEGATGFPLATVAAAGSAFRRSAPKVAFDLRHDLHRDGVTPIHRKTCGVEEEMKRGRAGAQTWPNRFGQQSRKLCQTRGAPKKGNDTSPLALVVPLSRMSGTATASAVFVAISRISRISSILRKAPLARSSKPCGFTPTLPSKLVRCRKHSMERKTMQPIPVPRA